jgi:hypothetical protein
VRETLPFSGLEAGYAAWLSLGVVTLAAVVGCCELTTVEIEFPLTMRTVLQSEHCDAWIL